ncbi:hypothetical protein J7E97_16140 [Streptomyces sp. ISL-66]|uniref:hypothetical protein n=1 Tax=Streptomyces sp. ISL-66 TaxID=2819186 RepID=UPI001BE86B2B|nr:hypothetical protein [Streptomyces sp. ISL-66]MBT2469364.1 hypothetical protein [Streptomyces sp. ISL-66]
MAGPLTPEDPIQPGGDAEQAEATVKQVIAWYNARLSAAHRQPDHDQTLVAAWRQGREEAADDFERLQSADQEETVAIAITYAARLKQLRAE